MTLFVLVAKYCHKDPKTQSNRHVHFLILISNSCDAAIEVFLNVVRSFPNFYSTDNSHFAVLFPAQFDSIFKDLKKVRKKDPLTLIQQTKDPIYTRFQTGLSVR